MNKKSGKHLEYLEFIRDYWKRRRCSPTTREMADRFHTSTSVVSYHLDTLEQAGLILPRDKYATRAIIPVEIAEALDKYFKKA